MKNLSLTQEEYFLLSCLIGHVNPSGSVARSLLDKIGADLNISNEDYDRIVFKISIENNQADVQIEINEEK